MCLHLDDSILSLMLLSKATFGGIQLQMFYSVHSDSSESLRQRALPLYLFLSHIIYTVSSTNTV